MKSNIVIFYKGVFDDVLLNKISTFIRGGFSEFPKAEKRLFAIFIELAQNISYYSAEKPIFGRQVEDNGIGELTIYETDEFFELKCRNLAPTNSVKRLTERCQRIENMNRDDLRQYKKELRSEPRRAGQKGGNIGLVQIALKSDHPIKAQFDKVDESNSWYQMSVKIDKV